MYSVGNVDRGVHFLSARTQICNPAIAKTLIDRTYSILPMLPCRIAVYATAAGDVRVVPPSLPGSPSHSPAQTVLETIKPELLAAMVPGLGDTAEQIAFVTAGLTAIMREAAATE